MKLELVYLVLVTTLTAVMWIPYVLNMILVRGIADAVGYPDNPKPLAPWAARMKAAHANAVENLVLFAARDPQRSGVYSYERGSAQELLPEEARRFRRSKPAWRFFEDSPPGYRRTMLHWIADAGFSRAVEDYLEAERRAVEDDIEVLTSYGPFRKVTEEPT